MPQYILKRVSLFIPTIFLVSLIIFGLMRFVPGDPAFLLVAGEDGDGSFTEEQLQNAKVLLGTDKSLPLQYLTWVGDMLRGDLGTSMFYLSPVADDVKSKLPVTIELTIMAMLLSTILAVPLGIIAAVNRNTWIDYVATLISITGVAMPTFWFGIMLIFLLVLVFNWLPPLDYADLWEDPLKNLQQLIFPAIALAFFNMAFIARVTRSSMLEVLREDYIRTARSKGLAERVVIIRHALKNAFLPVITVSGWQFGRLIAGTVIIESIFLVPGMGRLLILSVIHRDFTMVQAITMIVTVMVLMTNLLVDTLYAWLDPRIRYT
jgi:peptide/nickel transport system permease protein